MHITHRNRVILYSVLVIVIALILAPTAQITGKAVSTEVAELYAKDKYLVVLKDEPLLKQRAKLDAELEALKSRENAAENDNILKRFFIKADNAIKRRIISGVRDRYSEKINRAHETFKKRLKKQNTPAIIVKEYKYTLNGFLLETSPEEAEKVISVPDVREVVDYEQAKEPKNESYEEYFQPSVDYNLSYCEDGTPIFSCSDEKPKHCNQDLILTDYCLKCGCPENYTCVYSAEDPYGKCALTSEAKVCTYAGEMVMPGLCSGYKPWYCTEDAELVLNCQECGCQTEYDQCLPDGDCYPQSPGEENITYCSDGTIDGSCSAYTKPMYCDDEELVEDCSRCGCPDGQVCQNDGACKEVSEENTCAEGTPYRYCSPTKPNYCNEEGLLIADCDECGCEQGFTCEADGTCTSELSNYWKEEFNNLNDWTVFGEDTVEARNSQLHIRTVSDRGKIVSKRMAGIDTSQDYAIKGRFKITRNSHWLELAYNQHVNLVYDGQGGNEFICRDDYANRNYNLASINIGQWYTFEAKVKPSAGAYDVYLDNQFKKTCKISSQVRSYEFLIGDIERGSQNYGELYMDYFEVASSNITPPSTEKCSDGTLYGQCSSNKPLKCAEGVLKNNCGSCGCPWYAPKCKADGSCGLIAETCSDGTPLHECSVTQPEYCMNGTLIDKCQTCGCPDGYECYTDGTCIPHEEYTCSDGTEYYDCSDTIPYYCTGNGELVNDCSKCGCPSGQFCDTGAGTCYTLVNKTCSDGTPYGHCSATKPDYCTTNGILKEECNICGCPSGEECQLDGTCKQETIPTECSDGTPENSCSGTKPKFCVNASVDYMIDWCSECGCPSGLVCETDQSCHEPETQNECSDGTLYGQCSSTKPKYCENGTLINKCSVCGCSSGYECQTDGTCVEESEPPSGESWRDDFNSLNDWVVKGGGIAESTGGLLRIKTSGFQYAKIESTKMSAIDTSQPYTVKTKFKITQNSHWLALAYNKHVNLVYDRPGYDLICRYGDTNSKISSITVGQWYELEAHVHPSSNNYEVYVNGNLKKICNLPTDRGSYEFVIGDFESGSANYGEMYMDYFEVISGGTEPPEPSEEECSDGTPYGQCSPNKPKYCDNNGVLSDNCNVCYCPYGTTCQSDGTCAAEEPPQNTTETCSDGTPENSCSDTKPKYCHEGILINDCFVCGCPNEYVCYTDGSCVPPEEFECSDGTTFYECSSTKPKFCDEGELIDYCERCGCPANQTCQAGGSCSIS